MKVPGLLREPLLHFLLGGAALFGLYALVRPAPAPARDTIVVTAGDLSQIEGQFEARWHRAPSSAEMQRSVDSWVRDEVLYREGLALGLDQEDAVVRQRVAEKMAYVVRSRVEVPAPGEATLRAWYETHRDRFAVPARIDFAQVWFDPAHRADAEADAREALSALHDLDHPPADASFLGDPPPRGATFSGDEPAVAKAFGDAFAKAVFAIADDHWHGPITAADGWHLVRVTAREDVALEDFDHARAAVRADWQATKARAADEAAVKRMEARYHAEVKPLTGTLESP